ncbi:MAG: HlyD family efflux transporter periplasmic adaptor subunit [Rhodobacteraceae bacterium]|nr:HlyD family efflux transporter periplasmic adaptor subunit [Paracoccaceae bacterium]
MRFLRRSLTGLFLLALTAGLLGWAALAVIGAIEARRTRDAGGPPAEERVFAANVLTVTPADIAPVLTVVGEVRSRRTLEVRAATGGTVLRLSPNFEEGGRVAAGELLVAIDPADAEAALAVARADLAEAEAALADAERTLALARDELAAAAEQEALRARALVRARDLAGRGVGSEAAVETAELAASQAVQATLSRRAALAQAETRLDQARIALERRRVGLAEAERALANTRIVAEFDGVLSGVAAVEGGRVSANERLADLIDPAALEVSFRLSTTQYGQLLDASGRLPPATIEAVLDVFGADLTARGAITRESGAVGEGQTGRVLFASLEDAAGFRPGDFVTVRITEPVLSGVARLPAAAIDGAGMVLALGPGDRLEAVPVRLLRRQGDEVIVEAGALAGREVVAERSPFLGAGIRVRPIRPGAAAAAPPEPEMLELTPERRAALIAFVEASDQMPPEAKARVLDQLNAERVPAQVVARIESRMGG